MSSIRKFDPPDQEAIERQVRDCFDYGQIKELSSILGIPYSTLVKQLNPDCIDRSVIYEYLRFDWGCAQVGTDLAEKIRGIVWGNQPRSINDVTGRIEFPSKLAFSVTETEINTLELERIPLSHRLSAISELQRQLESYKNGLMMIDCEDSGGENGQQRGGRETQPRSVQPASNRR